jgi:hypothetical protein
MTHEITGTLPAHGWHTHLKNERKNRTFSATNLAVFEPLDSNQYYTDTQVNCCGKNAFCHFTALCPAFKKVQQMAKIKMSVVGLMARSLTSCFTLKTVIL